MPVTPASMNFSSRILANPNIVPASTDENQPLVLAVRDQLLVCQDAAEIVRAWLWETHQIQAELITTLLDNLPNPHGVVDVGIYRVPPPKGQNIFQLCAELQQYLALPQSKASVNDVSPNHVLVPAMLGHCCPFGPPSPVSQARSIPPHEDPPRNGTVIDAGYQWAQGWGQNPLLPRLAGELAAHRLPDGPGNWLPGIPDVPGEKVPASAGTPPGVAGRLVALAGHANFVSGVIAQRAAGARITIRSHNGAFNPTSDDFPTEATVARSVCESADASVIDLGFAFGTINNEVCCMWLRAFQYIRQGGKTGPVVVSPAGNQGAEVPRFPAALNFISGGEFPEMVGVGSLDVVAGVPRRSEFSNYGPWVTCSAIGSNVVSTFLHLKMALEDATDGTIQDFTANSWASWNGTSFATPKIVAEVCKKLALGGNPFQAWEAVLNEAAPAEPWIELGKMLPQLG